MKPLNPYRFKPEGREARALEFKTAEGVFCPTDTTTLLIKACLQKILSPVKMLDLGCGVGAAGLTLAALGLCDGPLYASDISADAVRLTRQNAGELNVDVIAREGSMYEPWAGERFDVIVDDISGVSDDIAAISPWFPRGVECNAGRDGTRWVAAVLAEAPRYLKKGGRAFFPVLSLSDEKKILAVAENRFERVEMIAEKEWFLPSEMMAHLSVIKPLVDDGTIACEYKFGAWIWKTKIFCAS